MAAHRWLVLIACTVATVGLMVALRRPHAGDPEVIAQHKIAERTDYYRFPGGPSEKIRTVYMKGTTTIAMWKELANVYPASKGWKWGGFQSKDGSHGMGWASKGNSQIDIEGPYLPAWKDDPWPEGATFIVRYTEDLDKAGELREKVLHGGKDPFVPAPAGYGETL